jgi:hypothetical protein
MSCVNYKCLKLDGEECGGLQLRENYQEKQSRILVDKFVLTFHRIFGPHDANLPEFLFRVSVLPGISGIGEGKDFN